MVGTVIKYGGRCIGNIAGACFRFAGRKLAFSEWVSECRHHVATAWNEGRRGPVSEYRKQALRCLNEGIRLYNGKHYSEALAKFKDAIEVDPQYGRAHLYYGNAQYKLHRHEEALNAWERAIRVDPDSEAADKARAKLERLNSKNRQVIHDIQEQLRKR